MDSHLYSIGEVARLVGVSTQTLRVWERRGLITPRRTMRGHRRYTDHDVQRANQISFLRRRQGWNPAAITNWASFEPARRAWGDLSIGARIRAARRARGLSIRDAAHRVSVSASFLSAVERGESPVTAQLLSKVADALEMPNTALVPQLAPSQVVVRRAERPRTLQDDGITWEELVAPGHVLAPAMLTVPPGTTSGGAYSRPGETFVCMLEGVLSFVITNQAYAVTLNVGDSILLLPSDTWWWRNAGPGTARAMYVEQLVS